MRQDRLAGERTAEPRKKLIADREAQFAAELARSVGRLDWWNIKGEHTAAEWAAQVAMYEVAPFGERRHDMRMAVMTANLMTMQSANKDKMTQDEFREMASDLMKYLPDESSYEDAADMEALERMRKG